MKELTKEEFNEKMGQMKEPLECILNDLNERYVRFYKKFYPEDVEYYWKDNDYYLMESTYHNFRLILYHLDDLLNLPTTADDLDDIRDLWEMLNKVMSHIDFDLHKLIRGAEKRK